MTKSDGDGPIAPAEASIDEQSPVLLPLALIAGIVTVITTLPLLWMMSFLLGLVASAAAAAIGAPIFWVARRAGIRGVFLSAAVGGGAGAISLAIPAAAEAGFGWPDRIDLTVLGFAAIIGAATGAIYGTVFDVDNLEPGTVRWRTMLILLVAMALEFALTKCCG